ncbi:unnamed protein product [Peronospora farinosa]|uniref:FAD-binding FR-type domain-containing protein n=1 Tax=Peronospora farinosa TaxID=134698 RepID=A0AAV0UKZ8_9STRA|nr:unnamed protein product [Peronospora farinosa]
MERRRTVTVPSHSPDTDADLDLLLDHEKLNEIELNRLLAIRTPPKRSGMRFLPKAQKASALELLSKTQTRVGKKMEVEPVVVSFALVLPFLFAGTIFYWKQDTIGTLADGGPQLKLVTWLKAHPNIGKRFGFDAIDVIVVGGFLLLQLNLVIGKLIADKESGKLEKAGYLIRTGRAFGMNGLYAMVISVILVARQSFLHKVFGLSVLYTGTWYKEGKVEEKLFPCLDETCSPKRRYGSIRNFSGAIAMVPLFIVAVSSMEWVRRRYFQRFIVLHCLSAFSVIFTTLHYYPALFWMVPAIILYGIYRAVSVFGRGKASVVSTTAMSNKIIQLELRRVPNVGSDFLPGQYVYIKVDSIGKEWHPFTISSSPLRNRHSFFLDAKVQGPFTSQLLTLMKMQQLHTVHVDGYYGSEIKCAPHMVFIAGGSGMTPFLSILDHLKALADISDREEMSTDDSELPRTLWVVWTCRDLEFLEAYAELLDAVNRCSRWKCKVWLHFTQAGTDEAGYDTEDDDTQTEPDDLSEENVPRSQRFYPASLHHHAFSGHNYMLGLPLFLGTGLGCVLLILWVFQLKMFSAKSFMRRAVLLGAGALGAVLGATFALYIVQRWNARKDTEGNNVTMEVAMGEMEVVGLDIPSPAPPSTPRSMPTPAQSLLGRRFLIEKERPDLGFRLRIVHKEIRENFGVKAEVALLVSGPADLQRDALLQARELVEPAFEVHQKSFLL